MHKPNKTVGFRAVPTQFTTVFEKSWLAEKANSEASVSKCPGMISKR